jgi:hypothetical protein
MWRRFHVHFWAWWTRFGGVRFADLCTKCIGYVWFLDIHAFRALHLPIMPIPTPHNELPQVNVSDLTLEEKVSLLSGCGFNDTPGVPRLGLPGTRVCDSATDVRGSLVWNAPATAAFPNATALAATWDEELIKRIGHELAEECKIKNVDVLLAPVVNLLRDQRHGRAQESYGESSALSAI